MKAYTLTVTHTATHTHTLQWPTFCGVDLTAPSPWWTVGEELQPGGRLQAGRQCQPAQDTVPTARRQPILSHRDGLAIVVSWQKQQQQVLTFTKLLIFLTLNSYAKLAKTIRIN